MLIPVRCFTCGTPVGHRWNEYVRRREAGEPYEHVLATLNVRRGCCKRMLLTHTDNVVAGITRFRCEDKREAGSEFRCRVDKERTLECI